MSLASLCESYHSIICYERAHIETDECGGPEFFSNGSKVLLVGGDAGKLDLDQVSRVVKTRTDIHYPKPRVLSMTQATELGTVYTPDEVRATGDVARRHDLRLHMDGARFANALASLNVTPKEITWQAGVDVLCLGGTKNGLPLGEAVIYFNKDLAEDFAYRCKQAGQLASKMRFISAPWVGILEDGAWLRHAAKANAQAKRLAAGLEKIEGIEIVAPTEANAVFAALPPDVMKGLRTRGWLFYTFIGTGSARFMCPWDTTDADVEALVNDARELSAAGAS
jgi:threonine aldolase